MSEHLGVGNAQELEVRASPLTHPPKGSPEAIPGVQTPASPSLGQESEDA